MGSESGLFLGRKDMLKRCIQRSFGSPAVVKESGTVTHVLLPLSMATWQSCSGPGPWSYDTCSAAASGGHLEVLQWARSQGCPWDSDTCSAAALNGHLALLQWARSEDCPWNCGTCSAAASGGHFGVLRWARSHGCPSPGDTFIYFFAGSTGDL